MPRPPSIPGTAPTGTGSPWLEPDPPTEQLAPADEPTPDPETDGGSENGA